MLSLHMANTLFCKQENVILVRDLFRDKEANEFIIATIPTVLAVKESARLLQVLRKEDIPCKRIIVNQVSVITASFHQS